MVGPRAAVNTLGLSGATAIPSLLYWRPYIMKMDIHVYANTICIESIYILNYENNVLAELHIA